MADIITKTSFFGGSWTTFKTITCNSSKLLCLFGSNIYFLFYLKDGATPPATPVYNVYEIHSFDAGVNWTSEVLLFAGVSDCVIDAMCEVATKAVLVSYIKNTNEVTVSKSYDGGVSWQSPEIVYTI